MDTLDGYLMADRFLPLRVGDPSQVGGYTLYALLGAGGMANVYLSFMPSRNPVAIKVVKDEFADDPEFRRRFKAEVTAALKVHGRYTAPIVDADPEGHPPWLAAAYIAGPSLHRAIAEFGTFPVPAVFRLLAGVGEGLAAIHAEGIVHRDLKPANVLLAEDGPRVIDFGIARAAESTTLTRTGAIVGTPAYMAPEQVSGGSVTTATDVFALGQLGLVASTGHPAFGDGHTGALYYRIVNEPPNLGDCPPELRPLIERCLAKDPAARPPVQEVIERARAGTADASVGAPWLPAPVAATLTDYDPSTIRRSERAPGAEPGAVPVGSPQPARAPGEAGGRSFPPVPGVVPSGTPPTSLIPPAGTHPPGQPGRVQPVSGGIRRRLPYIVTTAALVLVALVVGIMIAPGRGTSSNSANTSPPPVLPTSQSSRPTAGTTPASNSTRAGGYILQYSKVRFTLPGAGCGNSYGYPSSVVFEGTSPQVSVPAPGDIGDLQVDCNNTPPSFDIIDQGVSQNQAALVSGGSPDAAACYAAVFHDPIAGPLLFAQLHPGLQVCVANTSSSGGGITQITLLILVSDNSTTYDTTWTATSWAVPPSNS